jgi:hypothetical protein
MYNEKNDNRLIKSYIILSIIEIFVAIIVVPAFILCDFFQEYSITRILCDVIMALYIVAYCYFSDKLLRFKKIRKYCKRINIPSRVSNEDELIAMRSIGFMDLFILDKKKHMVKKRIRKGETLDIFEIANGNSLGLIIYNHEDIHAYAVIIPITEKRLILMDDAFIKSVYPWFKNIKNQSDFIKLRFGEWADEHNIKHQYFNIDYNNCVFRPN